MLSDPIARERLVEDEVTKAFAEERQRKQVILTPVRIDGAILDTGEVWAVKLPDGRHIGDHIVLKPDHPPALTAGPPSRTVRLRRAGEDAR